MAGLAFGSLIAFINTRITKKFLLDDAAKNLDPAKYGLPKVMLVNVLRFILSAAALLVVYILRNIIPLNYVATIIGTACGLTFISYILLWLQVRNK